MVLNPLLPEKKKITDALKWEGVGLDESLICLAAKRATIKLATMGQLATNGLELLL